MAGKAAGFAQVLCHSVVRPRCIHGEAALRAAAPHTIRHPQRAHGVLGDRPSAPDRRMSKLPLAAAKVLITELSEHPDSGCSHVAAAAEAGERTRKPFALPHGAQFGLQVCAVVERSAMMCS